MKYTAPPLTPERLYFQDKKRMDWDNKERAVHREIETAVRIGRVPPVYNPRTWELIIKL